MERTKAREAQAAQLKEVVEAWYWDVVQKLDGGGSSLDDGCAVELHIWGGAQGNEGATYDGPTAFQFSVKKIDDFERVY